MNADNSFTCWINGQRAGEGHNFHRFETADLVPLLKPGPNLVAVQVVNGTDQPNPAGLIGRVTIEYRDGTTNTVGTDSSWKTSKTPGEKWESDPATAGDWAAAKELGPMGMAPWGGLAPTFAEIELFAEEEIIADVFHKLGVAPDFDYRTDSGTRSLRYIHRTLDGADIYFISNKLPQREQAVCSFRVNGKRPEFWWPDTGRVQRPAVYNIAGSQVRVPLSLGPSGSVFVIFRAAAAPASERIVSVLRDGQELFGTAWKAHAAQTADSKTPLPVEAPGIEVTRGEKGTLETQVRLPGAYTLKSADGRTRPVKLEAVPRPMELAGPWELSFAPGGGAPEHVTLDKLISWSTHADDGVRHYSGAATYTKNFTVPAELIAKHHRLWLGLGKVEVMAEVRLNGHELGTLWKAPYNVEITDAVKAGDNLLEVKVVNLWINRMIGDEQLPEDGKRTGEGNLSEWPQWVLDGKTSPTGRFTFSSWKLWRKDEPLRDSGLIGPVFIVPTVQHTVAADK
jgi:hypothetical protein